jgi:hypothetical protein
MNLRFGLANEVPGAFLFPGNPLSVVLVDTMNRVKVVLKLLSRPFGTGATIAFTII